MPASLKGGSEESPGNQVCFRFRNKPTRQSKNICVEQKARDEERVYSGAKPDSGEWLLGERLRSLGSVHSDTWIGQAAELTERGYVAIYPVLGWWKERPNLERWGKTARYSLIVSIKTPSVSTDIYTTVENKISSLVQV